MTCGVIVVRLRGMSAARRTTRSAARRHAARQGERHAARAVLRPRLRARADAVHAADGRRADVERAREGDARARGAVVVVERLRVADEPRRPRGGRRPDRDVRRDGGVPRRRAVRAGGVRRLRADLRARLRGRAHRPHRPVRDRQPRRPEPARVGDRAGDLDRDRRRAARRGVVHRRDALGRAVGRRDPARLRRPVLLRRRGLADDAQPLRRALRPDRDHRARRVDRGDRRRGGVGGRRGHRRRRGARRDRRRRAVVAVLRRRRARRRAPAGAGRARPRAQRDRPRLLRLPALPDGRRASCCSRSG